MLKTKKQILEGICNDIRSRLEGSKIDLSIGLLLDQSETVGMEQVQGLQGPTVRNIPRSEKIVEKRKYIESLQDILAEGLKRLKKES